MFSSEDEWISVDDLIISTLTHYTVNTARFFAVWISLLITLLLATVCESNISLLVLRADGGPALWNSLSTPLDLFPKRLIQGESTRLLL
jgi:hypothetical protein